MDQSTVVMEQIEDGQKLVESLIAAGMAIDAAFWAWPTEDQQWYLYLSSPLVDREGPLAGYTKVQEVLRTMNDSLISSLDIKVLGTADPITQAVIQVLEPRVPTGSFAVPIPHRHRGMTSIGKRSLGGLEIDGARIYPPPIPVGAN